MPYTPEQSTEFYNFLKNPSLLQSPTGLFIRTAPNDAVRDTVSGQTVAGAGVETGSQGTFQKPVSVVSSSDGKKTVDEIMGTVNTGNSATSTPPPTPEDTLLKQEIESAKTEVQKEIDKKKSEYTAAFQPILDSADEARKSQIRMLESQYGTLIAKQTEANERRNKLEETLQLRTGAARYAPTHATDIVNDVINQGLQKIAELNTKKAEAVANINAAYDEKKFSMVAKQFDAFRDIEKETNQKVSDLQKAQVEALKKAQEENRKLRTQQKLGDLFNDELSNGELDKNQFLKKATGIAPLADITSFMNIFGKDTKEQENTWTIAKQAAQGGATKEQIKDILMKGSAYKALIAATPFLEKSVAPIIRNISTYDEFGNKVSTPFVVDRETHEITPLAGTGQRGETSIPSFVSNAIKQVRNTQFIDGSVLFGDQRKQANTIANKLGVPYASPKQVDAIQKTATDVDSSLNILSEVETLASKLITAKGIGAWAQAANLSLEAFSRTNDDARVLLQATDALGIALARAIQPGVITERDKEALMNLLPQKSDTKGSVEKKMELARSLFEAKIDAALSNYLGVKVQKEEKNKNTASRTTASGNTVTITEK